MYIASRSMMSNSWSEDWGLNDISALPIPIYDDAFTGQTNGTSYYSYGSVGYAISARSEKKDLAYKFVDWFIGEGQHWLAEQGYPSSRISDKQTMMENFKYGSNSYVIANLLESSLPGDWWYMPNRAWIDRWAKPLNNNVRFGKMMFNDFIFAYIRETNSELAAFKKTVQGK
jgi:ABC-type glycerol-3-phosphate transport system substrate-binding protein